MRQAFLVGALIGVVAAFVIAPSLAEARPAPGVVPLQLNGVGTQIGVVVTDGGYSVAPTLVDGGALTLPAGRVVTVQCSAAACIGTGATTTSCGGTSLAANAGEYVEANKSFTVVLPDATPKLSVMTPSGGATCAVWRLD